MPLTASAHPVLPKRVSLVAQTAESLCTSLRDGLWEGYLPGERELCAQLQVSRQTLRSALEALQQQGWIDTTGRKRRRILKTDGSRTRARAPRIVAAISPRPLDSMSQSSVVMVDQLRADLARAGLELVIHTSPACYSAHPARALDALVSRSPAAVWLLVGSLAPQQRWFVRRRVPCLVVGSCDPDIGLPSVDMDYRAACRHAGALLRRKGHRSIALIRATGDYGGDLESERGLIDVLGQDPGTHFQILQHDGTAQGVCLQVDRALRSLRPPTAYVVARAMHVITVMMHLMLRGKRIPKDVAVLSRDDETFLQHAVPSVTRYSTSQVQFARRVSIAARQLAEGTPLPRTTIRLMPKLVPGETV
ncbi:MAG: substrate-binding domain-containing protein [Verrucomicrobiaceae bacterium]|nr:substrate-binding domain-containing protein [Verrucomicrobiaceae bacterium]